MALVGLESIHFALLIKDDKTGVEYGEPQHISGAVLADIKPNSNSGTLYADNGPRETKTVLGDITVSLEVDEIPIEIRAKLLGHTVEKGVLIEKGTDTAPYVAIMFEALKSNGKKQYVKLLKGMFQVPETSTKTQDNNVNFQTAKIEAKFVIRKYDNQWRRTADEDAEGYEETTGATWYESVEPKPAPTE